ncbi:hypothetical protein C8Q76DRAFT_799024 [Earliella scabrosa]|nr:hypothetical protein C8Q76DRAFT_799024 [Earliella scabrosa]
MKSAFSGRKQRAEPRHTRTDKSCLPCAKTKTKCVRDPANPARCKKCEKKKLVCEWPEGEMSRRACDECKRARTRCLPPRAPNGPCAECEKHSRQCSRAAGQSGQSALPTRLSLSPPSITDAIGVACAIISTAGPSHSSSSPVAGPSHVGSPYAYAGASSVSSQCTVTNGRPSLQVDTFGDPPTTPTSAASSPRSYWSIVLPSEDDMFIDN